MLIPKETEEQKGFRNGTVFALKAAAIDPILWLEAGSTASPVAT